MTLLQVGQTPPTEPDKQSSAGLSLVTIGGIIGVFVILLYSLPMNNLNEYIRRVAFTLLMAGAAMIVGGFVGFLFGVPRRLSSSSSEKAEQQRDSLNETGITSSKLLYTGNTNLEEISDWLTKIIVGVSLVELTQILDQIKEYGEDISTGIGTGTPIAFGVALIIFYVASGFFIGYLWSRLFFIRALNDAENNLLLRQQLVKKDRQENEDNYALSLVTRQLSTNDRESPAPIELSDAIAAASPAAQSSIFFQARSNRVSNWRDNKAAMERSIPIFEALIDADTSSSFHNSFGELGFALKDKAHPDYGTAEALLTKAIEIRGETDAQTGYYYEANRALCRIALKENFVNRFSNPRDAVKEIKADLRLAYLDENIRPWISSDENIARWLHDNSLSWPLS